MSVGGTSHGVAPAAARSCRTTLEMYCLDHGPARQPGSSAVPTLPLRCVCLPLPFVAALQAARARAPGHHACITPRRGQCRDEAVHACHCPGHGTSGSRPPRHRGLVGVRRVRGACFGVVCQRSTCEHTCLAPRRDVQSSALDGNIQDCCCDARTVDGANSQHFLPTLDALAKQCVRVRRGSKRSRNSTRPVAC